MYVSDTTGKYAGLVFRLLAQTPQMLKMVRGRKEQSMS